MKRFSFFMVAATVCCLACNNSTPKPQVSVPVPAAPPKPVIPAEHRAAADNMEGNDCSSCHKPDAPMQGPSYVAIATKYATNADVGTLAARIIAGSSGIWGEAKMTPHPALSKEEAVAMVNYILSFKK